MAHTPRRMQAATLGASDDASPTPNAPLPSGTLTFCFTDIEGSTQLWEQHPQAMPAVLARHDTILQAAIHAQHGVIFKTVGDGVHAVFARAADALAAGRITLLGDAAHPMTPNMGQGACQALEDAVVLARCLGSATDLGTALRAYEQQRIPRTSRIVQQSRRIGQIGQWQHPLACALRDALTRHVLARAQNRQLDQVVGYVV